MLESRAGTTEEFISKELPTAKEELLFAWDLGLPTAVNGLNRLRETIAEVEELFRL